MSTPDDLNDKSADSAYYESLTPAGKRQYDRQELFLRAYTALGRFYKACDATEIPDSTVESWQRRDFHGFNKRLERARQRYVESWETVMDERLEKPSGNKGSDVLLMFKLKAEHPEKYREEVKVMNMEAPMRMLDKLREMATKERKALEQGQVVEGEIKKEGDG